MTPGLLHVRRLVHSLITGSVLCVSLSSFAADDSSSSDPLPVVVTTKPLAELISYPQRSGAAEVIALNHSKIAARVNAEVLSIPVTVGVSVKQGDVLATLDCRDNQFQLTNQQSVVKQLKADLAFSKREVKRGEALQEKGSMSESQLDSLKTSVRKLAAQVIANTALAKQAQLAVDRCVIKAPFNGIVTERLISEGQFVRDGDPAFSLFDNERLEVSVQIPLRDQASFNEAETFEFIVNDKTYPLTFQQLVPLISANSRSQQARFTFSDTAALAGSTGKLTWQAPLPHLPSDYLQRRQRQAGFFVLRDNKAVFISLENSQEGRPTPLINISLDENIIIDGRHGLNDGDVVSLKRNL